jgi:Domain of unknown function (DUF4386)
MKTLSRDPYAIPVSVSSPARAAAPSGASGESEVTAAPRTLARIAALMYVGLCATAFFAVYVHSRVVKSDNATATADKIRTSTTLFRVGFMSDILQAVFFLFTALALYLLLRHVHRLIAAAMVVIVAISVAIQSLNMLNQYTALMIATSNDYARVFGKPGSDALAMLFNNMQENGFFVAQMFFGLWLLPLGYLVLRSGYVPKVFGYALIVACAGLVFDMFVHFLSPGLADNVAPFVGVINLFGEMPFFLWLLVKGVKTTAGSRP